MRFRVLRCARVSVKLPPSGLQQAPSQLSTSSFPLHLKLPSSDDTLSSCWDCGGLHERVDGCVSLSRLATEFPALTDKAPTTYIARCKRPCIHSSPLPSGTRMRGPGLLIILTLAAVMLNSRIIRWQHSLLAKGRYLPDGEAADVAVILGYTLNRDGTPSPPLEQRVEAGLRLFEERRAENVIFSGGHPGGDKQNRSEAEVMLDYALQMSSHTSAPDRWYLEEESRSTRENALFSIRITNQHRWRSVVVVTNSFHQLRSYLTFRCAVQQSSPQDRQVQVWLAHVPAEDLNLRGLSLQRVYSSWDFYRELAALLYYWLRGWLCQSACLQKSGILEREPHPEMV